MTRTHLAHRPLSLSIALYSGALLLSLIAIGPALWMAYAALRPADVSLTSLGLRLTLANFRSAWFDGHLLQPLVTSAIITLSRSVLNVLFAAMAAYPLARMKFRGRGVLFALMLATLMIPEQLTLVPTFRIVVYLGLYDSLWAVLVPLSVTAFGIYLCCNAFQSIPMEIEEAARIDGAGTVRMWWHVMLPLIAPTLATLALFSAISAWSELLWPLVVLNSKDQYTLPVAISGLMGQFSTNLRAAYAGSVIALLPIVALFVAMQRFFRPEIFAGSVKG